MALTVCTTPDQDARCYRVLTAWATNDRLALDTALDEAAAEAGGVAALLLAVVALAVDLGERVTDDFPGQLQAALLAQHGGDQASP